MCYLRKTMKNVIYSCIIYFLLSRVNCCNQIRITVKNICYAYIKLFYPKRAAPHL